VITRLREVRRKRIRGAEDLADFVLLQERLEAVISDLEAAPGGTLEAAHIDRTARELASIQRHFALAGFTNVARVLSRVEGSLRELGDRPGGQPEVSAPRRFEPPPPAPVQPSATTSPPPTSEAAGHRPRRWLLLLVTGMLATGCLAGALIGLMRGHQRLTPPPSSPPRPVPTRAAEKPPLSPEKENPPGEEHGLSPGEMLAGITSETESVEAALRDGDVERALTHLTKAAAIDRHHRAVKAAAAAIVEVLVEASETAAEDGQWEDARDRLKHARNLATNFFLETAAIDRIGAHHDALARFVDTAPDQVDALEEAIGRRVRLTLTSREILFARLEAVGSSSLKVSAFSGVGGGQVRMERTIPLEAITVVRIYDGGEIDFSTAREPPPQPSTG
jgi:hypothetical protein